MPRIYSKPAGFTPADLSITIVAVPPVIAPVPSFTVSPNPAIGSPASVTLQDTSVNEPTLVEWDFTNDGTIDATNTGGQMRIQTFAPGTYTIRMRASNSAGAAETTRQLVVNPVLTIVTHPSNQTANQGQNATFSVAAQGAPTISYQWQTAPAVAGPWTNVVGATSASYTFATTPIDNGKWFRVVVTTSSDGTTLTSNTASLIVRTAPEISGPVTQSGIVGAQVTFSPTYISSTPITLYQWQRSTNGGSTWSNITGENGQNLTVTVTAGQENHRWRVQATNAAGTTTSVSAGISTTLIITTQPASQTANQDATATFNVVASGSGTVTYQWQTFSSGVWSNLAGSTTSSYSTAATPGDNGRRLRVIVSDNTSTITSSEAVLTVRLRPIISGLSNQSASIGQTITFSPSYDGWTPMTFEWQVSTNSGTSWTAIPGATSGAYTFTLQAGDEGKLFRVVASNAAGSTTSLPVSATASLQIITQPQSTTAIVGSSPSFTVVATGSGVLTYTWQRSIAGTWTTVSTTSGSTYTLSNASVSDSGAGFRVIVTASGGGSVTSVPCTLTVVELPSFVGPQNRSASDGQSVTFSTTVSGSTPMQLQWQVSTDGGATASDIPGEVGQSLTFTATSAQNGYQYRLRATNTATAITGSPVFSNFAALQVGAVVSPVITIQTSPASVTVRNGDQATFSVVASVSPTQPITYAWEQSINSGASWTTITGSSSTVSITTTPVLQGALIRAVVSSPGATTVRSSAATLTVKTAPTITGLVDQGTRVGSSIDFTTVIGGSLPQTYQWQTSPNGSTWSNVSGATGSLYSFTMSLGLDGSYYRLIASNDAPVGTGFTTTSNVVRAFVNLHITTQPDSVTVSDGATASFTCVAVGNTLISYQWQHFQGSWQDIAGETSQTYSVTALAAMNGRQIRCVVSNQSGSIISEVVALTVNSNVVVSGLVDQTIKAGNTVNFAPTFNPSAGVTYQWQQRDRNVDGSYGAWTNVAGETGPSYAYVTAQSNNARQVRVLATNGSGTTTSNAAQVTVITISAPYLLSTTGAELTSTMSGIAALTTKNAGPASSEFFTPTTGNSAHARSSSAFSSATVTAGGTTYILTPSSYQFSPSATVFYLEEPSTVQEYCRNRLNNGQVVTYTVQVGPLQESRSFTLSIADRVTPSRLFWRNNGVEVTTAPVGGFNLAIVVANPSSSQSRLVSIQLISGSLPPGMAIEPVSNYNSNIPAANAYAVAVGDPTTAGTYTPTIRLTFNSQDTSVSFIDYQLPTITITGGGGGGGGGGGDGIDNEWIFNDQL